MIRIGLVLALGSLAACKENNPLFCEGNPNDPRCATDAPVVACTTDDECAPQVCDVAGTQTCVECTADKAAACTGTSPICGDDLTCRGCAAHTECPDSNACLPDGSCADSDDVAYVAPTGSGTACSFTSPCAEVSTALATARSILKMTGTTNEQVTLNNRNLTVLADPGAKLTDTTVGILLEIDGTSQIAIFDLEISGALGPGNPGISMPTGNTAQLSLTRVKIDGNQGGGISSSGGALTVSQSTLSGNQGGGISSSGGALTVSQSTLSGNQGGGISVTANATFDITNNFIFRNGDQDNGAFGGVNLGIAVAGSSRLAFNTIVDNEAAINSGGVICNVPSFTGPNNIIARNKVADSTTNATANTSGACTYPTSKVQSDISDLAFVDPEAPAPFIYKLTVGSSAIDQATTVVPVDVDNEGTSRPNGPEKDIGADEL